MRHEFESDEEPEEEEEEVPIDEEELDEEGEIPDEKLDYSARNTIFPWYGDEEDDFFDEDPNLLHYFDGSAKEVDSSDSEDEEGECKENTQIYELEYQTDNILYPFYVLPQWIFYNLMWLPWDIWEYCYDEYPYITGKIHYSWVYFKIGLWKSGRFLRKWGAYLGWRFVALFGVYTFIDIQRDKRRRPQIPHHLLQVEGLRPPVEVDWGNAADNQRQAQLQFINRYPTK